ncbi:unnamed protein product [Sphagnum troendelagicum]
MEGRAQFVTLQSPDGGSLTIINIYAPRSSNDRAPLWRKLSQAEFASDHFIIRGDFNHLEETDRRGTSGERQMPRREAASWHHMTLQYELVDAWRFDSFRKMSNKEYTFDNGRAGLHSAVSRIDKFMISQDIEEKGGRIETAASVRKLSNHSPLVMTVWGNHPPPPPRQPSSLLRRLPAKRGGVQEGDATSLGRGPSASNKRPRMVGMAGGGNRARHELQHASSKRQKACAKHTRQDTYQKGAARGNPASNRPDQRGNKRYPFRRPGQAGGSLSRLRGAQPASLHSQVV